jgi:hypothetical protein
MASNEARAGGPGVLNQDDAFLAFYDATSVAAYSVALRVTGERAPAEAACEAAYLELWRESRAAASDAAAREARLLDIVRAEALRRRNSLPAGAGAPRGGTPEREAVARALDNASTLGRRAVELAYFAGLTVGEIAESEEERELLERVVGLLPLAAPAAEPDSAMRERLMERIATERRGPVFEAHESLFVLGSGMEWSEIVPGIEWKVLYHDPERGARTAVIRMAPNLLFPPHEHHGIEDLYLVEGTAWVGDIEMRGGDYCRAPEGTEHNDVRSGASGALAVVVTR